MVYLDLQGFDMAKKGSVLMELDKVCKIYPMGEEKLFALNNISITIHKGEFSSILGPSGSGKSTLLNVLGLLDEPSTGKIILDGVDTTKLTEDKRAYFRGEKIGFIFQMFNLIPSLTVLENVVLPAIIYEEDPAKAEEKALSVLEYIGMDQRLDHYPNQLSGGQRQRVAIARALINDPEIILADEPTGNLDTKTGHDVLEMFRELNENGKTVLIVTHDTSISKITEREIKIIDGKIVKS
jgi:putative ABC transport system ATP-binding protein